MQLFSRTWWYIDAGHWVPTILPVWAASWCLACHFANGQYTGIERAGDLWIWKLIAGVLQVLTSFNGVLLLWVAEPEVMLWFSSALKPLLKAPITMTPPCMIWAYTSHNTMSPWAKKQSQPPVRSMGGARKDETAFAPQMTYHRWQNTRTEDWPFKTIFSMSCYRQIEDTGARNLLSAALAFPCSLYSKSQLTEVLTVADSVDGTVINLSCKYVRELLDKTCLEWSRHFLDRMESIREQNTSEKLSKVPWDMPGH